MNQQQFIKKWSAFLNGFVQEEFESDLSSLFQTRSEEEVRESLLFWQDKMKESEWLGELREERREMEEKIKTLKWFLKE